MADSACMVGKRLLVLFGDARCSTSPGGAAGRDWLRGTVRAVKGTVASPVQSFFVEFDTPRWKRRSWVKIHAEDVLVLLLETSLVWAPRNKCASLQGSRGSTLEWPALTFKAFVDKLGLGSLSAVEFLPDRELCFLDSSGLRLFQMESDGQTPVIQQHSPLKQSVNAWLSEQKLQEIFSKGPYSVQGQKVKVFQPELEGSWLRGVVVRHDPISRIMEVNFEEHEAQLVDPKLVHVVLADDADSQSEGCHGKLVKIPKSRKKKKDSVDGKDNRRRKNTSDSDSDPSVKRLRGEKEADSSGSEGTENGRGSWKAPRGENIIAESTLSCATGNVAQVVSQIHPSIHFATYTKENGRTLVVQDQPISVKSSITTSSVPESEGHTTISPDIENQKRDQALLQGMGVVCGIDNSAVSLATFGTIARSSAASVKILDSEQQQKENSRNSLLASSSFGATSLSGHSLFGDDRAQSNGVFGQESKPLGFQLGGSDTEETNSDPSKNLFFQCMLQNIPPSNYFTAVSESLGKEPPSLNLFKQTADTVKDSDLTSGLSKANSQPGMDSKVSSMGNISLESKASSEVMPKLTPAFPGNTLKTKAQEKHENLFLQPPKLAREEPSSPFLAFTEKRDTSTFSSLAQQQTTSTTTTTTTTTSVVGTPSLPSWLAVQPLSADKMSSLFSMSESSKTPSFSSPFSTFSVSAQRPTSFGNGRPVSPVSSFIQPMEMPTLAASPTEEGPLVGSGQQGSPLLKAFADLSSMTQPSFTLPQCGGFLRDAKLPFEQSKHFSLDERSVSFKHDSDSSTNSDLSDLSDCEDQLQARIGIRGLPEHLEGRLGPHGERNAEFLMGRGKVKRIVKRRPRATPLRIGQSVLKDLSKVRRLKQTGEPFLQDGSCINVAPHLHKCRECRLERYRKFREQDNEDTTVACRFFHFRRLVFTRKGILRVEGFLSPQQSDPEAMSLWIPSSSPANGLDLETSKYILANVGDQFCQLIMSEKEAMLMVEPHQKMAWKRAVRGVRELCDVCETTLFNIHWVCRKCGFCVCLDCFRLRKNRPRIEDDDDDFFSWLKCAKGQPHEPEALMPTQIIPGTALYNIGDLVHAARGKWGIKANCPCSNKALKIGTRGAATNGVPQPSILNPGGSVIDNEASSSCGEAGLMLHENDPLLKIESLESTSEECGGMLYDGDATETSSTAESSLDPKNSQVGSADPVQSYALHWLADVAAQKAKEETKEFTLLFMVNNAI
ncbi:lysine-specific demethylase 3B-like [Protopterus annectens]|uniref:lysine-specific demethylase 3B-like n=1 Tax=Protopterus annectens TaxID=7888 RepID=UPI001CFB27F2|nr:lysine-specific demethylase 3B-like [Protopterus annectens]